MASSLNIKEKRERHYTQELLEKAVNDIQSGNISLSFASKAYSIPKGTLYNKVHGIVPISVKKGPGTILTKDEENKIADWIINRAKLGFPLDTELVRDAVHSVQKLKYPDQEPKRPGRKWMTLFLKRYPHITKRNTELISKARAAVTEHGIREWFLSVHKYLDEEGDLNVLIDQTRMFNLDETGIQLSPKTGKVLAPKNYKDTYKICPGKEKECITVLCNFSAAGKVAPPMVVFPLKRISKAIVESVPDEWGIGRSDSGWMIAQTFTQYIKDVFYPWVLQQNIELPIIIFMDGHKSHINMELYEFCIEKKVMLFCLLPNATHILQPCDVAIFKSLKTMWQQQVRKHTEPINKTNFAKIFKTSFDKISEETIKNGFKKCGLYPFNSNAVDYNKCISKRVKEIATITQNKKVKVTIDDYASTIKVIEKEIGPALKKSFNAKLTEKENHDHGLYKLWLKCKKKVELSLNRKSVDNSNDSSQPSVSSIASEIIVDYAPETEPQRSTPTAMEMEFNIEDLPVDMDGLSSFSTFPTFDMSTSTLMMMSTDQVQTFSNLPVSNKSTEDCVLMSTYAEVHVPELPNLPALSEPTEDCVLEGTGGIDHVPEVSTLPTSNKPSKDCVLMSTYAEVQVPELPNLPALSEPTEDCVLEGTDGIDHVPEVSTLPTSNKPTDACVLMSTDVDEEVHVLESPKLPASSEPTEDDVLEGTDGIHHIPEVPTLPTSNKPTDACVLMSADVNAEVHVHPEFLKLPASSEPTEDGVPEGTDGIDHVPELTPLHTFNKPTEDCVLINTYVDIEDHIPELEKLPASSQPIEDCVLKSTDGVVHDPAFRSILSSNRHTKHTILKNAQEADHIVEFPNLPASSKLAEDCILKNSAEIQDIPNTLNLPTSRNPTKGGILKSKNGLDKVTKLSNLPALRKPTETANLIQLDCILDYPEINKKKTAVKRKTENMPYAVTSKKFKKYIENKEKEKETQLLLKGEKRKIKMEQKNIKMEKKKILIEQRKIKLEQKKEKLGEMKIKSVKLNKEAPARNKQMQESTVPNDPADKKNIDYGKYVIAKYDTNKRERYFVGQIEMINEDERKCKVDFFTKPPNPDINEVKFTNIVSVLPTPIKGRREMIYFPTSSFNLALVE